MHIKIGHLNKKNCYNVMRAQPPLAPAPAPARTNADKQHVLP